MVGEWRCSGKEFHVLGAATQKLRLPNSVLVDGTHRSPRCAERSLTLPPTSVSGVQMPQKYEGQVHVPGVCLGKQVLIRDRYTAAVSKIADQMNSKHA